jgi:hypothetical protein
VDAISNPEDVNKVATPIRIKGMPTSKVKEMFDYIAPQAMSNDGKQLQDELVNMSRELANAGDNATGNINPERASGAAIIAVKDQQAIATTKQSAFHKQFIEDLALIWLDMVKAYNPNGLTISIEEDDEMINDFIPAEVLENLKTNVRIDVSPVNPFSKFAREQALENALAQGHITFEEYVDALDEDGNAPKGKFMDILEKRMEQQMAQQTEQPIGGEYIEMPEMPDGTFTGPYQG